MSAEKPFQRIIRERGGQPGEGDGGNDDYVPFEATGGYPEIGFALYKANGDIHMFLNHNLDNIHLLRRTDWQFLQFTHRGKAVTLKGHQLEELATHMMRNTLQAIHERGEGSPHDNEHSIVAHAAVSTLPAADAKLDETMIDRSSPESQPPV